MAEERSREDRIQSYTLEYSETDCGWLAEMLVDAEDRIDWLIEDQIMPRYRQNLESMFLHGLIAVEDMAAMAAEYRQNLYKGK